MYRQEPLSLPHTFKSTHDPLSNSRRLMGKFCPVVSILTGIVNRIRDEVSMAEIESMIEPNGVLNDFRRISVTLVHRGWSFHPTITL